MFTCCHNLQQGFKQLSDCCLYNNNKKHKKITSLTASLKVAGSFDKGTLCANSSTSFSLCRVANLPPLLGLEDLE